MEDKHDVIKGLGIGLCLGVLAGITAGLMIAPKEGVETRKIVRDKAGKFVKTIKCKLGKATVDDVKP